MATNAKKQHTVTRAYLERWADRGLVHVFDMTTGRTRRENVKNVATHRYFYSPPDGEQVIERTIAELEGYWTKAQDDLLARLPSERKRASRRGRRLLHRSDKVALAPALTFQLARTARVRRGLNIADPVEARHAHLDLMLDPSVTDLAAQLLKGIWLLGFNDPRRTGQALYTSDHPVCAMRSSNEPIAGYHRLKGFMFPLSPSRVLIIYAPKATDLTSEWDGRAFALDRELAAECNLFEAFSAERAVIAPTGDFGVARAFRAKQRQEALSATGSAQGSAI